MVELADSLDSGSSVHYGRAGSSPASRTKRRDTRLGISSFLLWGCEEPASYTGLPPQTSEAFVVGKRSRSATNKACRNAAGRVMCSLRRRAAKMLEFEYAAVLRDRIIELQGEA